MGRPELGTKCACASCRERFYDLNRSPAICPKCGAQQPPVVPRAAWPIRMSGGNMHFSRRPAASAVEEEVEPVSSVEAEESDEDEDDGVPEIEPDAETDPHQAVEPD